MSDQTPLLFRNSSGSDQPEPRWKAKYHSCREKARELLESRAKHRIVLVLVVLDVAGILSDIFIALITCELHRRGEKWVEPTRNGLTTFSLVLSCLFLLELLLSLWTSGLEYLSSWFHCFDAFVIVVSFSVDLLEHGLAEEIASLIVVLRLWRFVKIVNEFSVEASEQMEETQRRCEELEEENKVLRARLRPSRQPQDEEAAAESS